MNSKRLNLNLAAPIYAALAEEARLSGQSITQTLRDAISLNHQLRSKTRNGARVLVETDGRVCEVLL